MGIAAIGKRKYANKAVINSFIEWNITGRETGQHAAGSLRTTTCISTYLL